jgi:murein DD-endopeptidase MepM/ murein hydrolase activator NlpD
MRKGFKYFTAITFLLIFTNLFDTGALIKVAYAKSNQSKPRTLKELEEKGEYLRKKIKETKEKEKVAIGKLTQIQRKLYKTQDLLRKNKTKLITTQNDLLNSETQLSELKFDYARLKVEAENRIRQIYQGQRLKILETLLKAPNLTDFLDILYYQKLLIAQDKMLLEKLSTQSKEIEEHKEKLAKQKIKIAHIVSDIEGQKRQISREHQEQSFLVSKLRTERATYEKAERQLERESQSLIAEINKLVGDDSFSGSFTPGSGTFSYPVRGRLTSPFGYRRHPIFKVVSFHSGVDLAAPYGTPVMASDSGRVIFNGWYGGYGRVVIVDHGMAFSTLYAHLSSATASRGKSIQKGEIIGYEGQTGYSTGPHVHFEVRKNGRPQNPLNYLR